MPVPPTLNEEFLQWFRARTEFTWSQLPPRSVEEFLAELEQEEQERFAVSQIRSNEPLLRAIVREVVRRVRSDSPPTFIVHTP